MMTSLGMGTTVLSNAMSPAMSQYPPWASTERYQSENWCSSSVNLRKPVWYFATAASRPAQLAKTTLFASGNEADVRQTRRSAFGRPQVDPKGAVQGGTGTKSAAGDFF